MKIAIIIERAEIMLGGAERSVFELSTALGGLGHQVEILAAKGETSGKNVTILCGQLPGKRVGIATFQIALKKHFQDNRYDIIHSTLPIQMADVYQPRGGSYPETTYRNIASYESKVLRGFKRLTCFFNFHRSMLWLAEKRLCRNPDGPVIAALSEYVADQFRRHYKLADERIFVIPNGVKIDRSPQAGAVDKLRGKIMGKLDLKEATQPVFFLFAANNFRLKGIVPLLKALSIAKTIRSEREPYLVVAGSGAAGKYKDIAEKLGVDRNVVFLGSLKNMQNAYEVVDVLALPTYYDPASRVVLEALAAGVPVITTRFNGAVDLFVDQRHGIVIDSPGDIEPLAQAVNYYCDSENIRRSKEQIAKDNLAERISIRRAAGELDSLYESLLKEKGGT